MTKRVVNLQSSRAQCAHGHPLEGDNLIIERDKRGYPHRRCKTCKQNNQHRYKHKLVEEKHESKKLKGPIIKQAPEVLLRKLLAR